MKFFTRVKNVSDYFFKKHLLLTNTGIGVMFLGAGDAIQQNIEKKLYHGKVYDTRRTGNMMFAGSAFGVLGHYWYKFLDFKFPGASAKAVGKKILSEMAIGPPLFLGFFISIGLLEGKSVDQSFQQFKKNFFLILAADWAIYAPLQAINFFYVPLTYRVLYVCVLCLGYDVFLSYVIHKEDLKEQKGKNIL